MKFSFVECAEVTDAFAKVIPDNEPVVLVRLRAGFLAFVIEGTEMAIERHVG